MSNPSMTFNGIKNADIYLLRGRTKSPFHPLNRTFVRAGNDFRLKKTERGLLLIRQPIGFVSKDDVTQEKVIKTMTDWLISSDWGILCFDDEPSRRYLALLQNDMNDFEKIAWLRQGTLEFVAKATLGESKTINLTTQFATHNITGQTPTPWTTQTTFTAATNKFILESNKGLNITLNYNFIAGDVLTIDSNKRDIFLNGEDLAVALDIRSEWNKGEVEVGNIQLKASHATELKYDERYY